MSQIRDIVKFPLKIFINLYFVILKKYLSTCIIWENWFQFCQNVSLDLNEIVFDSCKGREHVLVRLFVYDSSWISVSPILFINLFPAFNTLLLFFFFTFFFFFFFHRYLLLSCQLNLQSSSYFSLSLPWFPLDPHYSIHSVKLPSHPPYSR